ncbi:MAG TPA: hypothetical protein VII92_09065 [Anaerolineae bacterium]
MTLTLGEHDAVLNGIRIHYTLRGSGPALIAISGGPGFDARCWDDFALIEEPEKFNRVIRAFVFNDE